MDKLMLGLATTGVGMLVVFFGLIILIACIYALTLFTGRKKPAKSAPAKAAPTPAPAPAPAEEAQEEEADDLQVIAAITAAISAIWQDEGHATGFVVRRVRRTQNSSARARAAREEQIYSHF